VRLACQRYLRDLQRVETTAFEFYFDWGAARRVPLFFAAFLRHSKGEWGGQPFMLRPWQQFIVANLFGWKRKDTGLRRFSLAYIEVPKKNGKSTFCAGIGLYMLVCDNEPGAEIYVFAVKKDQAKLIFDEATRMWEASPSLQKRVGKFRNNLHVRSTNSKFEPISSESDSNDGLNPSCGIGDEIHRHPNHDLFNMLTASGAARRQQLMIGITTAGTDRQSFCYSQHDQAVQILNGVIENNSTFAFVACLDQDEEGDWKSRWEDEREWRKANPNFGYSVNVEKLRAAALDAKQQPSLLNDFLRYHLNVWTSQVTRPISPEKWAACSGLSSAGVNAGESASEILARWRAELIGCSCYGGLDFSSTLDLSSAAFFFPRSIRNPQPRVLSFNWVPEESIRERSKKDRVPYDVWERQSFLFATPGEVIDYDAIRKFIQDFAQDYSIIEIGYDRWNATQIVTQLQEQDGIPMVQIGQGFLGMSAATKEFQKMVTGAQFAHGNNPVLTWAADNLVIAKDPAGNEKPDKSKAREKIDPIVAFINAINRAMAQPEVPEDGPPAVWRA
jgi:phage terminase large subunit-like protein